MANREDLTVVMNAGERTIGAIVCWSLDGYSAGREAFSGAIRSAWPATEAVIARIPSPKAALRAAVERYNGTRRGILFRPCKAGGFACVVEREENGQMLYVHEATVLADDTGPTWQWVSSPTGPASPEMQALPARIRELWAAKRDRVDSDELSATLVACMLGTYREPLLGAFCLRDRTGGVYFVPAATLDHLRAIRVAVDSASNGCKLQILTVSGTAENLAESAQQARITFGRHLAELKEEVAEFVAASKAAGKSADNRNIVVRAEKFNTLRARAALFRDVLGDVSQTLDVEISEAREAMARELEAL
jgi:hypothetical protein